MNILAIENSFNLSIAVKRDRLILEENVFSRESSWFIISTVKSLLEKAGLEISQIDSFCIGLGPGSFTGLRVALSTIKGFCAVLDRPLIGLSSFLAVAKEFSFLEKVFSVIFDAKRDLVYAGLYYRDKAGVIREKVSLKLIKIEEFLKKYCQPDFLFLGESIKFKEQIKKIYPQALISQEVNYPKASFLVELAVEKFLNKEFLDIEKIEPLYLYPLSCQVRKKKA